MDPLIESRHLFVRKLRLPRPVEEVFEWHERPGALSKLIPPGDPVRLVEHTPGAESPIGNGARVVLALGKSPFTLLWVARHEGYIRNRQFVDVQENGPFAFWRHTHLFVPVGENACVLEDRVEYALPVGALGDLIAGNTVRSRIERMFAWRHRATYDGLVRPDLY